MEAIKPIFFGISFFFFKQNRPYKHMTGLSKQEINRIADKATTAVEVDGMSWPSIVYGIKSIHGE